MLMLIFTACFIHLVSATGEDERNFGHERVLDNVMKSYREAQFLVRPAKNTSAEIGLTLTYIKSFDKRSGQLTAGYFLKQRWVDPRLSWEDLSVQSISVPPARIWKPDWRLFNSMDYTSKLDDSVLPIVTPDGTVIWVPLAEYTTACSATGEYQTWQCELKMGSWVHDAYQINPNYFDESNKIDVDFYEEKLYGFHVEAQPSEIETKMYECCADTPYQHAVFQFKISVIEDGIASGSTSLMSSLVPLIIGCVISCMY